IILTSYLSFFFYASVPHPHLHSFPTRRSSDLLVQYRSVGGSWGSPVLLESGGPVAEAATPAGTFVVASGSAVYTLLPRSSTWNRSEEHTSELQSLAYLVCRLLLEKKKKKKNRY